MNLSGWILKKMGWAFKVNLTMPDKCIIVIAPTPATGISSWVNWAYTRWG